MEPCLESLACPSSCGVCLCFLLAVSVLGVSVNLWFIPFGASVTPCESGQRSVNLVYLPKEPDFRFVDSLYHFLHLGFINFCSDLYYFLPRFGSGLFFVFLHS